jgi:enoyl-CoA hydratase/carnithine racemase
MSVSVTVVQRVALLTLNVPSKLNALSVSMGEAFANAVQDVKRMDDIRCVVVTGAGEAFSAGGDLAFLRKRLETAPECNAEEMRRYYARLMTLRNDIQVPTIAAINGYVILISYGNW